MIFIEFEGTLKGKGTGTSGDQKIKNAFVGHSMSFSAYRAINPIVPGKGSADRIQGGGAESGEVSISAESEAATALMFQEMIQAAKAIAKVTITIDNGSSDKSYVKFMTLVLENVYISNLSLSAGGDSKPGLSFSLNYSKFSLTTTGSATGGAGGSPTTVVYDIAAGKIG
jgi:type VI protein secretion system component Hcp